MIEGNVSGEPVTFTKNPRIFDAIVTGNMRQLRLRNRQRVHFEQARSGWSSFENCLKGRCLLFRAYPIRGAPGNVAESMYGDLHEHADG